MANQIDTPIYVVEKRLLEANSEPAGFVEYQHSVLVYDPDYTIIRSADIFQDQHALIPELLVHAGAERSDPLYRIRPVTRARVGGLVADFEILTAGSDSPLGWLTRSTGTWRAYDRDETLGAELAVPGNGIWRLLGAFFRSPSHFDLTARGSPRGALTVSRVLSPEGTGVSVPRWALSTDLASSDPSLFELVLAASLRVVVADRRVKTRTRLA